MGWVSKEREVEEIGILWMNEVCDEVKVRKDIDGELYYNLRSIIFIL